MLSKELAATLLSQYAEIASRVAKMRRKFAREYGFVVPEIKLTDEISAPAKTYQIRIHGTRRGDAGTRVPRVAGHRRRRPPPQRARRYRGENHGPGKDARELDNDARN